VVTLSRRTLKIQQFCILPPQILSFVLGFSEQKANISQYNINLSVLGSRLGVFTPRYKLDISIQCCLMLAFTPSRSWFNPRSEYVKFLLDRVATGQDFRRVPRFFRGIIIQTVFHTHQLPAGLLASFPYKLNTFRKRVKTVVTRKGIQVWTVCK
jgi:hypothetical protein